MGNNDFLLNYLWFLYYRIANTCRETTYTVQLYSVHLCSKLYACTYKIHVGRCNFIMGTLHSCLCNGYIFKGNVILSLKICDALIKPILYAEKF